MKEFGIKKYWFYDLHKILVWPWFYLWYRPKFYYEDKKPKIKGKYLLVANHTSTADVVKLQTVFGYRRHHIVAAKEIIEKNKFSAWMFKHLLCISVDRNNFSISSFKEIIKTLNHDKLVDIFSEGGLNDTPDTIKEFKSGASFIALKTKTPIVLVYFGQRKNIFKRLKVSISSPIDLVALGYNKDNIIDANNYLRDKEIELMNKIK